MKKLLANVWENLMILIVLPIGMGVVFATVAFQIVFSKTKKEEQYHIRRVSKSIRVLKRGR